MFAVLAIAAVCVAPPVDGPVVSPYAPAGAYAGHWGVDYAAEVGQVVRAPVSGRVTFAGSVAGMRTVTIEPVSGLKVSVSYLSRVDVATGATLARGSPVGLSGTPHGRAGVHMSVRVEGSYVDPMSLMGCRQTDITRALRLVTPPAPYPRHRANRNPRWDFRPDPRRPSAYGRVRPAPTRARSGADPPRR